MATPVAIDTHIRLASMRQINRAIDHAIQGEYECAITLAGAAEGMLPETWKPHFRQKIKNFAETPKSKKREEQRDQTITKIGSNTARLMASGLRPPQFQQKKVSLWSIERLRNITPYMMIFHRKCSIF